MDRQLRPGTPTRPWQRELGTVFGGADRETSGALMAIQSPTRFNVLGTSRNPPLDSPSSHVKGSAASTSPLRASRSADRFRHGIKHRHRGLLERDADNGLAFRGKGRAGTKTE